VLSGPAPVEGHVRNARLLGRAGLSNRLRDSAAAGVRPSGGLMVGIGSKRSFLFLQGLSTLFWVRLAREVESRGHAVHRINFSGGDKVFWPKLGAVNYRGRFSDWRNYLGTFLHENGITDIIVFGDCRPYHRVAIDLAGPRGIAVHVFEEGYFRPEWITLERDGTNAYSALPRDAAAFRAEAAKETFTEVLPQFVSGGFARRVRWEILNQTSTLLLAPFYPHFRRHRCQHPLNELRGWIKRLVRRPYERHRARRLSHFLTESAHPFYLLPLQLETDFQIRRHSPFKSMANVMEVVLESFARKAPTNSVLIVKLHPLDNGLVNFRRQAGEISQRLGLGDRVFVIDGGHLPTLLSHAQGVVVVNSTTGLSALHHNRPVKALGRALFDVPGLTFQGSLDRFWTERPSPDQELFRDFRAVVLRRAQINGSFFTEAGIELGVREAVERMQVPTLPGQAAVRTPAGLSEADLIASKAAAFARQ
jgi:capsular polysaccharide export protein